MRLSGSMTYCKGVKGDLGLGSPSLVGKSRKRKSGPLVMLALQGRLLLSTVGVC